jgi:hypothetical protein
MYKREYDLSASCKIYIRFLIVWRLEFTIFLIFENQGFSIMT